jgi:hypothetical protein
MSEDSGTRPNVPGGDPAGSDNSPRSGGSAQPAVPPAIDSRVPSLASYIPVGWLLVVMILALRGLISAFPFAFGYDLPGSVALLVYGGAAAGVVTLLWGLYVLSLALRRSPHFPQRFAVWQIALIAWLLFREAYVLVAPEFAFSLENTAVTLIEIAIGVFCLYLVRNKDTAAVAYSEAQTAPQPVFVSIIAGVLGVIVGGALGFGVGLGAGILIAEVTEMSCFEGACGFFAFFLGLGGIIIGAVAGGVFSVLRVNRRPQPAA